MNTTIKPLTPFQKNLKGEPIDLSKEEDVQLVIKRNSKLQNALDNGIEIHELNVKSYVSIKFQCVKCGSSVDNLAEAKNDSSGTGADWFYLLERLSCSCCGTVYRWFKSCDLVKVLVPKAYKAKKS
ncbi:hypothetical protein ACR79M_14920 [Sphingobacterium spiritivorum]|uniref:hypothetical protein n=1 Tax=Sphingobacterium spiritivorum TaxID=258 RepID=UPI003DA69B9B